MDDDERPPIKIEVDHTPRKKTWDYWAIVVAAVLINAGAIAVIVDWLLNR